MAPVVWLPIWVAYPLYWITQHQTLIAGLAAVAVGLLTVRAIRDQIEQATRAEVRLNKRRHLANIAGLPISFVEIIDYAEACWEVWLYVMENWETYEDWDRRSPLAISISKRDFPFEALHQVQLAIETAESQDAEKLADLLGFSQVQLTRFESLFKQFNESSVDERQVTGITEVRRAARDALELRFRASRCLVYARRDSPHIDELPGMEGVEEFLFFTSTKIVDELREYLKTTWHQHWHASR
jgi:hypothetical protein